MSRSFKILLIFLFQIPSSHFLFSPLFLSICSLILSLLQLGLDYNFHKTSSFLNGFTLRTPKSRSRLIQMLSHPFALACSLAHKNLLGQIEWKLTWWSAIRTNRRKVETNKMDFSLILEMALIAVLIGIFKASTANLWLTQPRDNDHQECEK